MTTSLPCSNLKRFIYLALIAVTQQLFSIDAQAQCLGNLLSNGSFELPAVSITNGNNIMGAGNSWGGWDCTNGGLNILRVQGSGYGSGANNAADGNQYVDVANSDGFIYQSFTLVEASPVYFSGSFSNRESGWSDYVNWTGKIDILNQDGNIVGTSATRDFITTDNNETWYTLTGSTSILTAGTYTYRSYIGNSGHFDNAAVCALSASILPVKLQSFTAILKGGQVTTNWVVREEENVKGYELQFSTDGINFKAVGFLLATNAPQYSLIHKNPVNGFNYYRLKTEDKDHKIAYSNICKVKINANDAATVYPNPARGFFHLSVKDGMVKKTGSLMILTMSGGVLQQKYFSTLNQTETIDIRQLVPGTYFVRLATENGVINKTLQVI